MKKEDFTLEIIKTEQGTLFVAFNPKQSVKLSKELVVLLRIIGDIVISDSIDYINRFLDKGRTGSNSSSLELLDDTKIRLLFLGEEYETDFVAVLEVICIYYELLSELTDLKKLNIDRAELKNAYLQLKQKLENLIN